MTGRTIAKLRSALRALKEVEESKGHKNRTGGVEGVAAGPFIPFSNVPRLDGSKSRQAQASAIGLQNASSISITRSTRLSGVEAPDVSPTQMGRAAGAASLR